MTDVTHKDALNCYAVRMKITDQSEALTMKVTICGPNLRDQSKGTFHIHAADCADLVRGAAREPEYRYGWTIEASTRAEVGDNIYEDHIAEGSMEPGQGQSDCHFFPCCAALT